MTPADIRAAKELIDARGLDRQVKPRQLARAAEEAGKGLAETLRMIAALYMAGQGQGPAPIAESVA